MAFADLFRVQPFAAFLEENPVAYFDVGARGGFEKDLYPLAFATDAFGFEPAPEECRRLAASSFEHWRSVRFLPVALAGAGGTGTLHVPADATSASLLCADAELVGEFRKPQFFDAIETFEVGTETLDGAVKRFGIPSADYLKLDVEGAELAILEAPGAALDKLLAIKVEVAFAPFRLGQGTAFDVGCFLAKRGFVFADLIAPAFWRREGYVTHPHMDAGPIPYSRGRLAHGDFLFLRDPATLADDSGRMIKSALIAMCFGYFDHALAILERKPAADVLSAHHGADPLAALSTLSRAFGRRAGRRSLARRLRALGPFARRLGRLAVP